MSGDFMGWETGGYDLPTDNLNLFNTPFWEQPTFNVVPNYSQPDIGVPGIDTTSWPGVYDPTNDIGTPEGPSNTPGYTGLQDQSQHNYNYTAPDNPNDPNNTANILGSIAKFILPLGLNAASMLTGKTSTKPAISTANPANVANFKGTAADAKALYDQLLLTYPQTLDPATKEWYTTKLQELMNAPARSPEEEQNRQLLAELIQKAPGGFDPSHYERAISNMDNVLNYLKVKDIGPGFSGPEQQQALQEWAKGAAEIQGRKSEYDIAWQKAEQAAQSELYTKLPLLIQQYESQYGKIKSAEDLTKMLTMAEIIPQQEYERYKDFLSNLEKLLGTRAGMNLPPNQVGASVEQPSTFNTLLSGFLGSAGKQISKETSDQANQGALLSDFITGIKSLFS